MGSEEIKLKKCAKCQRKLLENSFHMDKRARDGLQKYCKECKTIANSKKEQMSTTNIEKALQITKLQALSDHIAQGKSPVQAYRDIQGYAPSTKASLFLDKFLANLQPDVLESFKQSLQDPQLLGGFFKYLDRACGPEGSIGDERDAWALLFKILNLGNPSINVNTSNLTPEKLEDKFMERAKKLGIIKDS